MKLILGLLASLILSAPATATSIYGGPYLVKTVGNPETSNTWATCEIYPAMVRITRSTNGLNSFTDSEIRQIENMRELILDASDEPTEKALHVVETIPHVTVSAGSLSQSLDYELFYTGSFTLERVGPASAELMEIVEQYCGDIQL